MRTTITPTASLPRPSSIVSESRKRTVYPQADQKVTNLREPTPSKGKGVKHFTTNFCN